MRILLFDHEVIVVVDFVVLVVVGEEGVVDIVVMVDMWLKMLWNRDLQHLILD